ncbi:hypothetical protein JCM13664_14520 [Methylothermus subterraneus]
MPQVNYSKNPQVWSATLRWLHLGLAVLVSLELGLGLGLTAFKGNLRPWLALGHELLGLMLLGGVLFHWGWLAQGHDGGLARLWPRDKKAWREVVLDVRALFRFEPRAGGVRTGLAGLVQGLGLLLVSVQGLIGLTMFLLLSPNGELPARLEFLKVWHQALAWGVLGYLSVHLGMALWHAKRRDGTLAAMWPWR